MNSIKSNRSGRVVFDDRGCAVWEWRTAAEEFTRDIDTHKLQALQDDALQLAATGAHAKPAAGCDPYNTSRAPQAAASHEKRKSLDDLRRLSEQIKRARDTATK